MSSSTEKDLIVRALALKNLIDQKTRRIAMLQGQIAALEVSRAIFKAAAP